MVLGKKREGENIDSPHGMDLSGWSRLGQDHKCSDIFFALMVKIQCLDK